MMRLNISSSGDRVFFSLFLHVKHQQRIHDAYPQLHLKVTDGGMGRAQRKADACSEADRLARKLPFGPRHLLSSAAPHRDL